MTDDHVEGFIESILLDQPPKAFSIAPEDADVLQVAIQLRAVQGQYAWPEREFVERLHRRLSGSGQGGTGLLPFPVTVWRRDDAEVLAALGRPRRSSKRKTPRRLDALVKAAAAAFLVAATFTATSVAGGHGPTPAPQHVADSVRSGNLLAADGRRLGQSYVYNASPSWVFMDVEHSGLAGTYTCDLHLANGERVTAGFLLVYRGSGEWAHTVNVDVSQIREAVLETPAGQVVATAAFS
jgi:hypothetical protein